MHLLQKYNMHIIIYTVRLYMKHGEAPATKRRRVRTLLAAALNVTVRMRGWFVV